MHHFFQIGSFRLIAIDVFMDNMPDVLNGLNIVDSLVLSVVLDTAFCLTNSACAGAS